jgi:hypothetical protein
MIASMDAKVKETAVNFLSQSYSVIKVSNVSLKRQIWIVDVLVSTFGNVVTKKVRISNKTGNILHSNSF